MKKKNLLLVAISALMSFATVEESENSSLKNINIDLEPIELDVDIKQEDITSLKSIAIDNINLYCKGEISSLDNSNDRLIIENVRKGQINKVNQSTNSSEINQAVNSYIAMANTVIGQSKNRERIAKAKEEATNIINTYRSDDVTLISDADILTSVNSTRSSAITDLDKVNTTSNFISVVSKYTSDIDNIIIEYNASLSLQKLKNDATSIINSYKSCDIEALDEGEVKNTILAKKVDAKSNINSALSSQDCSSIIREYKDFVDSSLLELANSTSLNNLKTKLINDVTSYRSDDISNIHEDDYLKTIADLKTSTSNKINSSINEDSANKIFNTFKKLTDVKIKGAIDKLTKAKADATSLVNTYRTDEIDAIDDSAVKDSIDDEKQSALTTITNAIKSSDCENAAKSYVDYVDNTIKAYNDKKALDAAKEAAVNLISSYRSDDITSLDECDIKTLILQSKQNALDEIEDAQAPSNCTSISTTYTELVDSKIEEYQFNKALAQAQAEATDIVGNYRSDEISNMDETISNYKQTILDAKGKAISDIASETAVANCTTIAKNYKALVDSNLSDYAIAKALSDAKVENTNSVNSYRSEDIQAVTYLDITTTINDAKQTALSNVVNASLPQDCIDAYNTYKSAVDTQLTENDRRVVLQNAKDTNTNNVNSYRASDITAVDSYYTDIISAVQTAKETALSNINDATKPEDCVAEYNSYKSIVDTQLSENDRRVALAIAKATNTSNVNSYKTSEISAVTFTDASTAIANAKQTALSSISSATEPAQCSDAYNTYKGVVDNQLSISDSRAGYINQVNSYKATNINAIVTESIKTEVITARDNLISQITSATSFAIYESTDANSNPITIYKNLVDEKLDEDNEAQNIDDGYPKDKLGKRHPFDTETVFHAKLEKKVLFSTSKVNCTGTFTTDNHMTLKSVGEGLGTLYNKEVKGWYTLTDDRNHILFIEEGGDSATSTMELTHTADGYMQFVWDIPSLTAATMSTNPNAPSQQI